MSEASTKFQTGRPNASFWESVLPPVLKEVTWLLGEKAHAQWKLDNLVPLIANRMETDVCSVYLLRGRGPRLVLAATVGLRQSCVGNLRMGLEEGLVGLTAQLLRPVVEAHAMDHPRFKYFPEADEDRYQSFLGVPIARGDCLLGVLVVQTIESRCYSTAEVFELEQIASTLGECLHDHLCRGESGTTLNSIETTSGRART